MGLYNVGFAGRAGGEFAERQMEQILKQRMFEEEQARMRAAQEQQAAAEQQRMTLDRERFSEGKRQFEVGEARLTAADAADQAAKDAAERRWFENISQMSNPAQQRFAEARHAGVEGGDVHDYELPDVHAAELEAASQAELDKAAALADIQGRFNAKWREPRQGPADSPIWVTRNGKTLRIRESEYQPGDEPYSAAAGQEGSIPATLKERVAGARASVGNLDRLETMMGDSKKNIPSLIGPGSGRLNILGQKIPGIPVNEDFASFAAETATLKNAIIKAVTGAQMSEPEAARIMQQIPDVTDKPEVWAEKARTTRQNIIDLEREIYRVSGVPLPERTGRTPTTGQSKPTPTDPLGLRR